MELFHRTKGAVQNLGSHRISLTFITHLFKLVIDYFIWLDSCVIGELTIIFSSQLIIPYLCRYVLLTVKFCHRCHLPLNHLLRMNINLINDAFPLSHLMQPFHYFVIFCDFYQVCERECLSSESYGSTLLEQL